MKLFLTLKTASVLRSVALVVACLSLSACYVIVDMDGDTGSNERATDDDAFLSESRMGSRCSYSDSGNFGTCPIAGVESVGSMCTCPSPEGQMTGTVVR
jgi:hypothetical protein